MRELWGGEPDGGGLAQAAGSEVEEVAQVERWRALQQGEE
jgi:hypothetical protein